MSGAAASPGDQRIPPVAEQIIDRIQSVRQPDLGGDGEQSAIPGSFVPAAAGEDPGKQMTMPRHELPGFAEETQQDDCGEELTHFCDDCGHTFEAGRTCGQSRCPRCAPKWVMIRAEHAVARLDTVARVKSARLDEKAAVHKHHVSVMPPAEWMAEDNCYERTKRVIKEMITECWDAEGVAVYHPWSGSGYDGAEGDDLGEWSGRLFSGRSWDDVLSELHHRPHFHLVIAAEEVPTGDVTTAVYEETGWIIRRHQQGKRSIDGMDDLARVMTYCFSHAGIDTSGDRNQSAIHYFGSVWHDPSIEVRSFVEDSAVYHVRNEASGEGGTLGIAKSSVRCAEEVPEDVVDAIEEANGELEDGDGDGTSSDDAGEGSMTNCRGAVRPIDAAGEYLDDDEWRDEAYHVYELEQAWKEHVDDCGCDGQPPPD